MWTLKSVCLSWSSSAYLYHLINMNTHAQSICIHYYSISGRPDIFLGSGTLKKVQNMGCKKQGAKKPGSLLLKMKKRQPGLCSFWIRTRRNMEEPNRFGILQDCHLLILTRKLTSQLTKRAILNLYAHFWTYPLTLCNLPFDSILQKNI